MPAGDSASCCHPPEPCLVVCPIAHPSSCAVLHPHPSHSRTPTYYEVARPHHHRRPKSLPYLPTLPYRPPAVSSHIQQALAPLHIRFPRFPLRRRSIPTERREGPLPHPPLHRRQLRTPAPLALSSTIADAFTPSLPSAPAPLRPGDTVGHPPFALSAHVAAPRTGAAHV